MLPTMSLALPSRPEIARANSKGVNILTEDYDKAKLFVGNFYDLYMRRASSKPESHPIAVLENFELKSMANARRGLAMAINDIVEDTSGWHPEQVASANREMNKVGAFTLSEIRRRYSKKYFQVLKRGVIRSETEYYLLKGIVDGGGIEPGATEGQQIEAMLAAFEAQIMKN